MSQQEGIYAFIDSQNVNLAIRDQGWRLDFERFRVYLKEKYHVKKAFLFLGYIAKYQSMYDRLKSYGYELVFKPTLEVSGGDTKGNVDAELVLHTMIEYLNYCQAIIVSGGGDFYCLVDYLDKKDKLLNLLIPNAQAYSSLYKPLKLEKINFMTPLKNILGYKKSHV